MVDKSIVLVVKKSIAKNVQKQNNANGESDSHGIEK